ncbi:MAG: hypothetical protein H6741_21855 [Alphaproteobacteria bacterium]|nr:hypothetical protein [Alphaproteobacteria bacterium]MCB9795358.1 hypothetical protein [Alphaproteobacteria bacterium]
MLQLALLPLLLTACEEPPPPPPPEPEPPRLLGHSWEGNVLSIEGFPSSKLEVKCCTGGKGDAKADVFPRGAVITVGDTRIEPDPSARARVEIASSMGGMDISAYKLTAVKRSLEGVEVGAVTFTLPIAIQLQGESWAPIEATSPEFELKAYSAKLFLSPITEGPVAFVGDEADDSPETAAVLWRADDLYIIGEGTTLQDVDWIITEVWGEKASSKRCGGYSNVRGVPGDIRIEVQLFPSELTVYERRSGKVLATKSFPAQTGCPTWASSKEPGQGADQELMRDWIAERVAAGGFE